MSKNWVKFRLIFDNDFCFNIQDNKIIKEDPYFNNTRYGTMIGRGCPYHCTYCSNNYMLKSVYPGSWSKTRFRKGAHVINELVEVKKKLKKVERINFYDEVLITKKTWFGEFLKDYKNKIDLPFYCMFYPGTCDERSAIMLKDAGLAGVWIGIQSGSERVRKEIFKRHYSNEQILRQVELFQKYNISVKFDVIFENPFETPSETEETIQLLRKFPKPLLINMFSLKYFPNTEITQMALKNGIISKSYDQLLVDRPIYIVAPEKHEEIWNRIHC